MSDEHQGARLRAWHEAAADLAHRLGNVASQVEVTLPRQVGPGAAQRLRSIAHGYKGWRDWREQQRELSAAWEVLEKLDDLSVRHEELEPVVESLELALDEAARARVIRQRAGDEAPETLERFGRSLAGVRQDLDDLAFHQLGGRGPFFVRVRKAGGMMGEVLTAQEEAEPESRVEILRQLSEVRGALESTRRDWLRYIEEHQVAADLPRVQVFARVIERFDRTLREGEAAGVLDNAFGAASVERMDAGYNRVDWRKKGLRSRGKRVDPVRGVALHYTGGTSVAGSVYVLRRDGYGYHYIVDRDGAVYQLMDEDQIPNHAGKGKNALPDHDDPDQVLIGIAFANIGYERPTEGLRAGENWISAEGRRWEPYTAEQLEAAARLVAEIFERQGLVSKGQIWSHQELAPGRKHDPGPAFPLARFRQRVAADMAPAVASVDRSATGPYMGAVPERSSSNWRDWWWLPAGAVLFGGLAWWERRVP